MEIGDGMKIGDGDGDRDAPIHTSTPTGAPHAGGTATSPCQNRRAGGGLTILAVPPQKHRAGGFGDLTTTYPPPPRALFRGIPASRHVRQQRSKEMSRGAALTQQLGAGQLGSPAEQQWGGERGAEQGAERGSSPPSPAVTQAGIHRPEGSSGVTALGCLGPALCAAQTPLFYCLAVCPDGGGASSAGNLSGRSLLLGQKLQGGCSRLPVSVTPPCTSPAAGAEPPSHAAWVLFGGGRGWEGLLGKTPALPDATQRLLCAHLRLPKGIAVPAGGLREAERPVCPMRGQGSPRY